MADHSDPPVLVDMMALKIDGPAIVFIRPREALTMDATLRMQTQLAKLARELKTQFVVLPPDVDIMAIGDVDLKRYGLARLTPSLLDHV